MELTATEGAVSSAWTSRRPAITSFFAHSSLQAAFRFHRQPNEQPTLALEWTRFPDSSLLAAVAESAVVTTLVTSEGKRSRNQADDQEPGAAISQGGATSGASILSADVGGEKVKPVQVRTAAVCRC